jgi:hypothetical protein
MKSGKVHIDNLRVRAQGLTPDQARRLGEMVAQRLADVRLGGQQSRNIRAANVHVRSNSGSVDSMANEIVASIRRKLS